MNSKLVVCLVPIFVVLGCNFVTAQSSKVVPDKKAFDNELDKLFSKDLYIDSLAELKVVFTLKVDSIGEVHSTHIMWNKNLKCEEYYSICFEIEKNFILKFIYEKYKDEFIGEKYVLCRYPYFSNKKD
ncbi:MAG: hypothetical protein IPH94_10655 [Saprospiraceae bacterium]|nr:hypothetical protein [Saprospiraceae bacterium]